MVEDGIDGGRAAERLREASEALNVKISRTRAAIKSEQIAKNGEGRGSRWCFCLSVFFWGIGIGWIKIHSIGIGIGIFWVIDQ